MSCGKGDDWISNSTSEAHEPRMYFIHIQMRVDKNVIQSMKFKSSAHILRFKSILYITKRSRQRKEHFFQIPDVNSWWVQEQYTTMVMWNKENPVYTRSTASHPYNVRTNVTWKDISPIFSNEAKHRLRWRGKLQSTYLATNALRARQTGQHVFVWR